VWGRDHRTATRRVERRCDDYKKITVETVRRRRRRKEQRQQAAAHTGHRQTGEPAADESAQSVLAVNGEPADQATPAPL